MSGVREQDGEVGGGGGGGKGREDKHNFKGGSGEGGGDMLVSVVSEVKEKVGREEKRKGGKMRGKKKDIWG